MPRVSVDYAGVLRTVEVSTTSTVLDVLRQASLILPAPCGGKGSCGKCALTITDETGSHEVLACKTLVTQDIQLTLDELASTVNTQLLQPLIPQHKHGIAIDLGTTSLAAELVDLETGSIVASAGCMNPQVIFGADVISRIEAAEAGQLEKLRTLVVEGLYSLISNLCSTAELPLALLQDITLAGNTVMEHLVAGLSPASMGVSPYKPLSLFGKKMQLWQNLPAAWLAPCVSAYVGGDTVAGMLSATNLPFLLIDLGTNGELAICTQSGSYATATAAGPVFEGMNILYGMPALSGAIDTASYDKEQDQLSMSVINHTEPRGICGSGLIDLIAILLSQGLLDETGRLLDANSTSSPLAKHIVEHGGVRAFKPLQDSDILLTQKDIRAFQLAKAAIAAGIEVLLYESHTGLEDLAIAGIAGSFGQHINKKNAVQLGLIPATLLTRSISLNNSSLSGARKALIDSAVKEHMQHIAEETHAIELSTHALFSESFIENMNFNMKLSCVK